MEKEKAIQRLKDILEEVTEDENAICYVTDYDEETLKLAIESLGNQEEHDKQVISDAIIDFVKAYTKFMDEDGECGIYQDCIGAPSEWCIDCFKEKWLEEQK